MSSQGRATHRAAFVFVVRLKLRADRPKPELSALRVCSSLPFLCIAPACADNV